MVIGMARNLALPQADVVEGGENLPRFCQLRPRAKGRAPFHPSVETVRLASAVDDDRISFLTEGWNTVAARDKDPGIGAGN